MSDETTNTTNETEGIQPLAKPDSKKPLRNGGGPKAKDKAMKPAKTRTAKAAKEPKAPKAKKEKKEKTPRGPNPISEVILAATKKVRAGTAFGWEQVVEHLPEVDTEKLISKEKPDEQARIVRSRLRPWAKNGEHGISRGEGANKYVRAAQ